VAILAFLATLDALAFDDPGDARHESRVGFTGLLDGDGNCDRLGIAIATALLATMVAGTAAASRGIAALALVAARIAAATVDRLAALTSVAAAFGAGAGRRQHILTDGAEVVLGARDRLKSNDGAVDFLQFVRCATLTAFGGYDRRYDGQR
jgi:hypothetical protein